MRYCEKCFSQVERTETVRGPGHHEPDHQRATQNVMHARGMPGEVYRNLLTRLSTALAMTQAAYVEAKRRRIL